MNWWRRFDAWWKEDAGTFSNGFVLVACAAWVLLIIQTIGWLIGLLV